MSTQENKEFIRRYLETLSGNPKPPELVDQFVADEALRDHILTSEAAFPCYELHIEKMIAEEDLVSVIGRGRGTHKGPFMGVPPTGKSWEAPIHITYRVADGKIVDHWMLFDGASMMQQLGLVPSAAGTD